MRARTRFAILGGLALVVVLAAVVAGSEGSGSTPAPTAGSVRLGPEPGQAVAEYRADLARGGGRRRGAGGAGGGRGRPARPAR
ncbi:MAG: hypothetical protein L0I76_17920, partial [Pseudonocardia sp.]|nr:hypothetical protein [Pseudonocardia sp.]